MAQLLAMVSELHPWRFKQEFLQSVTLWTTLQTKYLLAPAQRLGFPQLYIAYSSRLRLCGLSLHHFHALETCDGNICDLRS